MEAPNMLTTEYLALISTELERLRMLREYELGVTVEYEEGDPYVKVRDAEE